MSGGRGVMVILGGLAATLLVIAIVSGWQGANRLRGQGEGMNEVEEAARLFVEAYGTFDFREPAVYRERLLSLSTGAHNHPRDPRFGWICILSARAGRVVTPTGRPSALLAHEYAHLLAPNSGHGERWRAAVTALGHPAEAKARRVR